MTSSIRLALPVLAACLLAAPAGAQTAPVVDAGEMDAALEAHLDEVAADRQAVRDALELDEVKGAARELGLDLESARTAVDGLEGDDLREAGRLARAADAALAGGQSVTISTTTIIIALLLLIIIILIAD